MNIKVLFVSNHAGFSKFNAPYVDLLYRNGIEVIDAAPGNEVPLNAVHVDIPVARNPLSWGNLWAYVLLGRVVREENITHVHCHTPVGGLLGRLLKLVRPRLQVMYTAHGFHFFRGSSSWTWVLFFPIETVLAALTRIVVTINREDFALAKRRFPCRVRRIRGVGVDLTRFRPDDRDREIARRDLGIRSGQTAILCVAQFVARKNHSLLISAFHAVLRKDPDLVLVLVGGGTLQSEVQTRIGELGIGTSIRVLGYRKDVPTLYRACDIAVSASRQEGFPVNMIEALASGLPLVASDIRGQREILSGEARNFSFASDDQIGLICALQDALAWVRSNEYCREPYVRLAREFSLERSLASMAAIYEEFLGVPVDPAATRPRSPAGDIT